MPEYVWIYDNIQDSEYVSHNVWRGITLQVVEYLLRDRRIFRTLSEWFGKMIIVFNYFRKKLHLELLIDCRALNMSELWIFVNFLKYDRVLNMRLDAIMKGLWIFLIYRISAYPSVAQGSEYALVRLKNAP